MSTETQYKPPTFPWGKVTQWHRVGQYAIAEYINSDGGTSFHAYVGRDDTHHSFSTLDDALIDAIAYRNMEVNTAHRLAGFFSTLLTSDRYARRDA